MTDPAKALEWRRFWPLPFVALWGMAGSGIAVYSTGVFMGELTRAFGWTKTQYSSAMTIQLILLLVVVPAVGRAVDRFGPRAVALAGIVPTMAATAALGLADGRLWQWWMLMGFQTIGAVMLIPPVWITAVVGQFHASRGLALAVALAGIGVGTALWPMLAAFFIERLGWRLAYGALAVSWGVVIAPLTFLFFYGPQDRVPLAARTRRAAPFAHHLRSGVFLCFAGSGGLFVLVCQAMTLHLVPILRGAGVGLAAAAGLAGVAGVASIAGRLATGVMLDAMPAQRLGVIVFLLPAAAAVLLAFGGGSMTVAVIAALLLGLSMGAEGDILNYLSALRFDHAVFGSIASAIQTVTAVTSVGGVMAAAAMYDRAGSYTPFLMATIPLTILGAILLALLPAARTAAVTEDEPLPGVIPATNQPLMD